MEHENKHEIHRNSGELEHLEGLISDASASVDDEGSKYIEVDNMINKIKAKYLHGKSGPNRSARKKVNEFIMNGELSKKILKGRLKSLESRNPGAGALFKYNESERSFDLNKLDKEIETNKKKKNMKNPKNLEEIRDKLKNLEDIRDKLKNLNIQWNGIDILGDKDDNALHNHIIDARMNREKLIEDKDDMACNT